MQFSNEQEHWGGQARDDAAAPSTRQGRGMRSWRFLTALALLAVAALAGYWLLAGRDPSLADGPGLTGAQAAVQSAAAPIGVVVEASPVASRTARREALAVGTLRSYESLIIRPEIASRVAAINFREGERVAQGQVLVQMDASIEKATLTQVEAELELAKANYARAQMLANRDAGTRKALDEARAALRTGEAAVALARARLEKMTLVAPFEGVVGLRKVSVGDYLAVGTEIVNLEQIDPLKIDFRIPELFLPSVQIGQRLEITVDALPGRKFTGEIYAIDPLIDAAGRSLVLRARTDNPGMVLRPGLFARVNLTLEERPQALFVPEQALVPVGSKQYVYRVVDGKAALAEVQLGIRHNAEVEIIDGLRPGDVVVTAGQIKLQNGMPVQVRKPGTAGAG